MAELPYLGSYKNVGTLFERIASAKAPDTGFSTRYLADTLGLKSTGDRQLITLLKTLGFLDLSGKPNPDYLTLKNPTLGPKAIAQGVRRAYGPLFAANERANELSPSEMRGLIAQVTGADTGMVAKISGTLQALLRAADFSGVEQEEQQQGAAQENSQRTQSADQPSANSSAQRSQNGGMRPEFHYNIQVHLPANGTEETYLHIFNAMRKAFSS
ncbi:MAG TPA: DUF5343 domain-containing protein [Steroidobacteraceae bacterium]|jgi:hypothetical protein